MKNTPKILKAERDLTGRLTIDFEDLDEDAKEKKFTKAFEELRAGISWPIRRVQGSAVILGLYSGCRFGSEGSSMLVYEKKYDTAPELIQDLYNRAHDLRFQVFHTDPLRPEWKGFVHEFQKRIRLGLGGRDMRIIPSPFPNDFILGKDIILRLIRSKAFDLPTASLLRQELAAISPDDLDAENPEYKYPLANAFRYLAVAWQENAYRGKVKVPTGPDVGPLGWA